MNIHWYLTWRSSNRAAKTSGTKLLLQAKLVDCRTWFLMTFNASERWTLWRSFVRFQGRVEVDFGIYSPQRKFSTVGAVRGRSQGGTSRPECLRWNFPAPARTKESSVTPYVGIAAPQSGIQVSCRGGGGGRCVWNVTRNLQHRGGSSQRWTADSVN